MDLYDGSLRKWLEDQRTHGGPSRDNIMKILHDILMGLIELHDRNLAHGDIKPGNILVRNRDLKVVLGDCGFVSMAKYAKVERTAAIYREKDVTNSWTHDMFSFGICFLEIVGNVRISRQASYKELKPIIHSKLSDELHRKLAYNLLHEDKSRRPTARNVLLRLFREEVPVWIKPVIKLDPSSSDFASTEDRKFVRKLMKTAGALMHLKRASKGYDALMVYINEHRLDPSHYRLYATVTMMILSSTFGEPGFRESDVIRACNNKVDIGDIRGVLSKLLGDTMFLQILFAPTVG
jgi:serine/threonine protein kinase